METNQLYMYPRPFTRAYGILSERQLREKIERGEVPGISTAKGYKINVHLFLECLEEKSREGAAI